MNQAQTRTLRPVNATARPLVSAISLLLLLSVLAVVLFVAIRSPLKDDIAWLLYVARRWMAGRELYIDVVEVNPPLIVWISAIPISLARWLGVDSHFVAIPVFIAAVLACAWWSASLLRANGGIFSDRLPVFALIGSVFLIVPAGDLGQREHLLAAAFLPYLVLFARRLEGGRASVVSLAVAGVLAGLGCALKPRYGAVFAVLECLALTRGLRPWRVMPIAAGATLLGYAGLVAIVCPAYLRRAVPLALALYGATDVPFLTLLSDSALLICGQLVAIALLWLRRRSLAEYSLMLTLVVFAATSTAICFVDGKDWYYHRLPATIITVLGLMLWGVSETVRQRRSVRLPLVIATFAVSVFCYTSIQRFEPSVEEAVEPQHTTQAHLEQIIRTEHARTYIAFSEWIALGFPVVNETGVVWASRFDSMWALKGEVWRARFDPSAAKEWPIARWVAHDFIAGCPDIAVVDMRETTNYIKVLSAADPAFARAWSRYRRIDAFDGLTVYRRGKAGCLDVWVAAEAKPELDLR
jgi:hypothetical protein